jgi:hypothetical protein
MGIMPAKTTTMPISDSTLGSHSEIHPGTMACESTVDGWPRNTRRSKY